MDPEKIPFATLLRIERGELPMTPAAELQLARLAKLMKRALPDTGVSQVLTQTASVLAKVIEPIASSFATDALKFSSLAAKLPILNQAALGTGFDKISLKSIGANHLNVGPINALTLSISVLNKTQFDGTLKALEALRPFVEQLKRIATRQSEIKTITLEVYKNEKELYYKEYGIRVPYELFWDWFLEKNGDLPLWRVFEDATYEAIAEGYGRYIAEKRHKRISNSDVHFEILNAQKPVTNLLRSTNNQISTYNQLLTSDEMQKVVREILAPLGGYNHQQQKIMSDDDFNRLVEYTDELVIHDKLPNDIKIIQQIGISSKHIRFTFYRLHRRLFTTIAIKGNFILLIHALFRQFENVQDSTTRTKFSERPTSYFRDFNLPEEVI